MGCTQLPAGFVDLAERIPTLRLALAYAGTDNFVGERIDGYLAPRALLSEPAAAALQAACGELAAHGATFLIFDAYRPQRAVEHFLRWADAPETFATKSRYYPDLAKGELFALGYLASRSAHSRGSTLDLSLCGAVAPHTPLAMGTEFDFFGPASWPACSEIDATQRANREFLRELMARHGFQPHPMEWWHFTLRDEPFPDTYFDFPVE